MTWPLPPSLPGSAPFRQLLSGQLQPRPMEGLAPAWRLVQLTFKDDDGEYYAL